MSTSTTGQRAGAHPTSRPARAISATRTPRATRAPFGQLRADRLTPDELARLPLKQFLAAWGGAR